MSIQSWLNSIWYDRAAPPWWMVPLSLTYGAVSGSRRFLYVHRLRKASRISAPVVVVGNVSVGGTGAPVAIGRDRPAAAQLLVGDGCNVIVSDDGLQHYALARDCEVVVIDGDRRFGNGWLLPAGPLRGPPSRLSLA